MIISAIEKEKVGKLGLEKEFRNTQIEELDEEGEPEETNEVFEIDSEEAVFEIFDVSEKAEFPGGEDSLQRFVYDNLVYPSLAKQNNAEGTVTVMFVINEIGEIQDVTVVTSLGQGLDQEAVRLIKKTSGLWKPAKQRDKPVSMRFRIPIKFELPN
jgi:protein TonB